MRYDFGSDNTAGMAPAALEALAAANGGFARAYGADEITARAADQIRQRLDADAEVRFVFSGTAANAIGVSMLARPYEAVLTHHAAHICTDETGAPGFFGQGVGLIGLPGYSGKIDGMALRAALEEPVVGHRQPAAALSVTQATEYGAVYSEEELRHLIEPAKLAGLGVHMDGARLANAVAADVPADTLKEGEQLLIVPRLARHGFEIVDKRSGKEVYLDGSWAELFQQQITAWQAKTPTQEEVEDKLEQYAELAQNPVVLH